MEASHFSSKKCSSSGESTNKHQINQTSFWFRNSNVRRTLTVTWYNQRLIGACVLEEINWRK